ncbi:CoA transferase subunit A [Eremococcus coleocola]|uniref:CoA transferase n=1 Tax=Eremococcus coleocola ACS-139-V-Col8 TaxID=908337 RepID=E4KRC0_9LACT|nr:3-oxoacid CoA-transferase subunit A [Eremococcus coleocola]EFR30545.1 CoA transferase [Eremococcus coleocola ACS-139-V-Col8]
MVQFVSIEEAVALVKKGARLGTSGFIGPSAPIKLIKALADAGTNELTLIQPVTSFPGATHDIDWLAENNQIAKGILSHTGTSKQVSGQFLAGDLEVEYTPMGTIIECLHAAGAGLGGVLTPTGVGTTQEENHKKVEINGKEYLFYEPLPLDVAFVKASKADKFGNLVCQGTEKFLTKEMALAADIVIAEVSEIVETGDIDPDDVFVPGVLVDYVVQGMTPEENTKYYTELWGNAKMLREG